MLRIMQINRLCTVITKWSKIRLMNASVEKQRFYHSCQVLTTLYLRKILVHFLQIRALAVGYFSRRKDVSWLSVINTSVKWNLRFSGGVMVSASIESIGVVMCTPVSLKRQCNPVSEVREIVKHSCLIQFSLIQNSKIVLHIFVHIIQLYPNIFC